MDKKKVSIAIAALNEEANIKKLLESLLDQNQDDFVLEKILIISDGSTDSTVSEIKKINSPIIHVIEEKERAGKPKRLNQLLSQSTGDYVMLFDADVLIQDKNLLKKMVADFDNNTALICSLPIPLPPTNYIQKVFLEGLKSWDKCLDVLGNKAELYYCHGRAMGLSGKYAAQMRLPDDLYAGTDYYTFFYAKKHGFETKIVKDFAVYYQLPRSVKDYLKQMRRGLRVSKLMAHYFSEEFVNKYNTVTPWLRFKSIIATFTPSNFVLLINYVFLQILSKIESLFYSKDPKWEVILSSKKLSN